jgi:phytanoyl-CoA hydroxylase
VARLSDDQVAGYDRVGYLVLPGFVDAASCRALMARADELIAAFDPEAHRSVFTTDDQTRTSDEEFLASGGGISFFYEAEAFGADGRLDRPLHESINKIGHALHDLDPVFSAFSRNPDLAAVATDLGLVDPLLLQSMYILKPPHIGGEVSCHQDATFLITDPPTVTGFWFALEDATLANGCLWAAPGGHRGPLRRRFARAAHGPGTVMEDLDPTPLPAAPDELVALPVPAGTLVVLHGLLPHWSGPNRTDVSRHAYSLHVVEAGAAYAADNWLQRPASLPLRGF